MHDHVAVTDHLFSTRFSFARRPYPYAEHGLPDHLMRGLPVPCAATLRTVPTAITLAFFTAFFLIDAGTTEAFAIADLSAFATIATTITFAIFVKPPLVVALITKVGAVVAGGCFLNKRFHLGDAVRKGGTGRRR